MKLHITIIVWCCLFVVGVSRAGSVSMPILKECAHSNKVKNITEKFKRLGYDVKYYKFDVTLYSHPRIIEYVVLTHKNLKKEKLLYSLNSIKMMCSPENRTVFNKSDEKVGEKILNTIRLNEAIGIKNNYIVVGDKKIEVFYKQR